jgi:Arf-GAP/coiled-coil/ANK repeat/PH domain-containing protein
LKNKGIKSFNKGITLSNKNNFKNLSRPESDSQNTNYNFLKLKANSNYFLRNKSAIQNEHQKRTSTKLNETMQINESYHNKAKQKHTFKDKLTITQQAFFHIKDRNFIQFKNIFIKNKLSPNLKDKDGNSLLSLAVKTNCISLVKYLLSAGANVNSQNLKGNTPLHFALSYHDYNIADLLISNGANEKIVNNQGSTPWQCLDINYSII